MACFLVRVIEFTDKFTLHYWSKEKTRPSAARREISFFSSMLYKYSRISQRQRYFNFVLVSFIYLFVHESANCRVSLLSDILITFIVI